MKFKSTIYASFLFLTTLFTSTQSLSAFDYDFGCSDYGTPYDEAKWSLTLNGGVSPSWFQRKGRALYFNYSGDDLFAIPTTHKTPRFSKAFDLPWNLGIEFGYMYCDRLELFADFNYTQAGGRHHSYKTSDVSLASKEKIGHYRAYDFYLGTRYYLFPVFSNLTPFFGGKVGLVTRDKIRGSTRTVVADTSGVGHKHTHFRSDTTISGGLHAGVNWDLSANLSVTLKAEAIWSGDWRPTVDREEGSSTSVVETPVSLPIIVHGKTGPILSVPVTLGIRYAF